ncbi:MAG: recombination-associated protein RdgC [Cellvibrionaceae bacterium]
MWFKNLQIYRLTRPLDLSPEELSEKLAEQAFVPCGSHEQMKVGWVPPIEGGGDFIHAANGYMMFCQKRQEKIVPAQVINEEVAEQVQTISERDGRNVSKKEQRDLKDEALFSLLPKAFSRSRLQYAYIDIKNNYVVVNVASASRAEEMLTALRETLGSLPVIPLAAKNVPQQVMTGWLKERVDPETFELGHECELQDLGGEGGIIRCKYQDLKSTEINQHLLAGMVVNKVGLLSERGVQCVVDHQLSVKSLKFSDVIQDKAGDVEAETAAEQFDIDFCIMTEELAVLIFSLVAAFGGMQQEG